MSATIVRYRVAPGRAEENAELIRAVYAELAWAQPPGFRYTTSVLDDGSSFVHIGITAAGEEAPLPQIAAFRHFREGIAERCVEPPQTIRLPEPIGTYRL